jgi:heterodisulfide reductase subunit C
LDSKEFVKMASSLLKADISPEAFKETLKALIDTIIDPVEMGYCGNCGHCTERDDY